MTTHVAGMLLSSKGLKVGTVRGTVRPSKTLGKRTSTDGQKNNNIGSI